MKLNVFLFAFAFSVQVFAAEYFDEGAISSSLDSSIKVSDEKWEQDCPSREKLRHLCIMIAARTPDRKNPKKYAYETAFLEAGCVKLDDSIEQKYEKIRGAWRAFEEDLKCDNTGFDIRDGHLVKFAVTEYFDEFIRDIAKWKVNLNRVDPADGLTILDYIQYRIEKNKGNSIEVKLKEYYGRLRAAGGKHRAEL